MNDYHHRHHHDHCHYRHFHHHHGKWNLIGELMSICLVQQHYSIQSQHHNQNYHCYHYNPHLYYLDHCHYHHHHYHHSEWNLIGELMSIRLVQQLGAQIASQTLTNEPFHLVRTLRMFFILDQTLHMHLDLDQTFEISSML